LLSVLIHHTPPRVARIEALLAHSDRGHVLSFLPMHVAFIGKSSVQQAMRLVSGAAGRLPVADALLLSHRAVR